jgi:hypothetical protein
MLDFRFMVGAVVAGITVMVVMLLVASWLLGSGDAAVAVLERPSLDTAAAPRIEPESARRVEGGPAQAIDPKASHKASELLAIPASPAETVAIDAEPTEPAAVEPPAPPIKQAEQAPIEPKKSDAKIAEISPSDPVPAPAEAQSAEVEHTGSVLTPAEAETLLDSEEQKAVETKSRLEEPKRTASPRAPRRTGRPRTAMAEAGLAASKIRGLTHAIEAGPPSPDITGSIHSKPEPAPPARPRVARQTATTTQVIDPFTQFFRDLEMLRQQQSAQR